MNKKVALFNLFLLITINPIYPSYSLSTNIDMPAVRDYLWENQKYAIGAAAAFGISSFLLYNYYNQPNKTKLLLITLKATQAQKLRSLFSSVSDKSITNFYLWSSTPPLLTIPEKILNDSNNLKEIFEKNNLITGNVHSDYKDWSPENWQEALQCLIKRAQNEEEVYNKSKEKINFDMVPGLLQDAKSILKSFLPTDEIYSLQKNFITKTNPLRRLFTYTKLAKVIEKEKLSHIHLPLKLLVIKDKKTNKYITDNQRASALLDDMIKIFVRLPSLEMKINYNSHDYELFVLAEKKTKSSVPLSPAAFSDLRKLVNAAPFDIGYDNIFSDSTGDAVIIDTEYKGEPVQSSLQKLKRYLP